jgi:hypothetical protein
MDEIKAMEKNPDRKDIYDNMSLMDSFLKETARLNPIMTGMCCAQLKWQELILSSDNAAKGDCTIHLCRWDQCPAQKLDMHSSASVNARRRPLR